MIPPSLEEAPPRALGEPHFQESPGKGVEREDQGQANLVSFGQTAFEFLPHAADPSEFLAKAGAVLPLHT